MDKKPQRAQSSKIPRRALYLTSLFLVLIFSVFVMSDVSLGWFSSNRSTNTNGMQVNVQSNDVSSSFYYKTKAMSDYEPVPSSELPLTGLYPGDTVSFKVVLENRSAAAYSADIILNLAEGGEVPLKADYDNDGTYEYYYFGTQLQLSSISSSDTGANADSYNTGAFLAPNESGTAISVPADNLTLGSSNVATALTLPGASSGGSGRLEVFFDIKFVNMRANQNAYQSFGSSGSGETCRRSLYINLTPSE